MSKPAPLSVMAGEFRGLVTKGAAAPVVPIAAPPPPPIPLEPPPRAMAEPAVAEETPPRRAKAPAPRAARAVERDILQRPHRTFELTTKPPPARAPARVQVGLRLTQEHHDQLREASHELRIPVQAIIEELIGRWLADFEAGEGS